MKPEMTLLQLSLYFLSNYYIIVETRSFSVQQCSILPTYQQICAYTNVLIDRRCIYYYNIIHDVPTYVQTSRYVLPKLVHNNYIIADMGTYVLYIYTIIIIHVRTYFKYSDRVGGNLDLTIYY